MKRLLLVFGLLMLGPKWAMAWNPITDITEQTIWRFGKSAEIGTAVKLTGSDGEMKDGETATSMLADIADYRFLSLSFGGTQVNKAGTTMTDTLKIGFRLTSFFDLFKNPTTPEMAFMKNINLGPSFAMSLFNSPHVGTLLFDLNYRWGGQQ